MPQDAWPQQGLFPADGVQCGPYTANEWAAWMSTSQRADGMVRTGAASPPGLPATPQYPNIGVYYGIPNQLTVTEAPANRITIGTGAWLCDGRFGFNDTSIAAIDPSNAARTDYVVVRQNYTAADFVTGPAGAALTVAANTCGITIIDSTNFDQDQNRANYWDVPLYSYDIDVGGVITNLTDLREWVDAEVKREMVRFPVGYNHTTGPAACFAETWMGLMFSANEWKDAYTAGGWAIPDNFIAGVTATPLTATPVIVVGNGVNPGTAQFIFSYTHGACAELRTIHNATTGAINQAILGTDTGKRLCLTALALSLTNAAVLDIADFKLERVGSDGDDDYDDLLYAHGVLLEYLAYGR